MNKLEGRVALVTGGSRGIGSGICKELARAGARIALNYTNNEAEALKVASEIEQSGAQVRIYRTDVSQRIEVNEMVKQVIVDFGTVDILVNNAGICPFRDFFDIDEETWNRTIHVNLSGMFFTSQAAARHMKEQGRGSIVNISTVTALRGGDQQVHYTASKGGVNSLTTSMACALREYGIRVNSILCGGVLTDINREQVIQLEQAGHRVTDTKGVRSLGIPEDLGKAVVYLASDDSEWVTGSLMAVDGGALSSPV